MLRFLFFLILLPLLATVSCKSEPPKTEVRAQIIDSTVNVFQQNLYTSYIDTIFAKHQFNGSIAIIQKGNTVYSKNQGFSNFKDRLPIDSNTVFAIGSLSKQFTAVLILLQQEAGRLNIDDPASKYLQEFSETPFEKVTIRHLLYHTSGTGDFSPNLISEPGEKFSYSNKGYRFLGKIIEKVSGKSYGQNAMELFNKTGMNNTFTPEFYNGGNFGSAHLGNSARQQPIENMPMRLAADEISVPAGGILSTVKDLDRWNQALFSGKVINAGSLNVLKQKISEREHYVLGTVGYGAGIMMNLQPPEAYFHSGYVKGSPSLNIYYPGTKTSVIILSNIADESMGKEAFFQPHAETKQITDAVQNSLSRRLSFKKF